MPLRAFFYMLLVCLLAIASILGYALWPALRASLAEGKVIAAAEPLTELYFDEASSVPQTLRPLSFSFIIHNVEGRDMTYSYTVRAEYPNGRTAMLDHNAIPIAANDTVRIPETLQTTVPLGTRIVVELTELGQQIAFRIK